MSDISVDNALNDIEFKGGDLVFTSDKGFSETMRQKIRAYLKTFLGEWFLDDITNPSVGIGYFQHLLGRKDVTIALCDSVFRASLINIEGVTKVQELAFDLDVTNRDLVVTFSVQIASGEILNDTIELSAVTSTSGASY